MDYHPPDHFEMPTPMIQLQSYEGKNVQVHVKVAQSSLVIKEMLEVLGFEESEIISIPRNAPEISGAILGKIVQWANHHKDDPAVPADDENKVKPMDDISIWDTEFLQVDQTTLFQIIRAANYLNIKGLLDLTCKTVAKRLKGTVEDVRQILHIQNDFSPEEEEQICKENAWCEGVYFEECESSLIGDIPADSVQTLDNQNSQVILESLSNPVIVREVLEHFPDRQLLEHHSFLNKLWSYEARSVIKQRGNLTAHLKSDSTHPWPQVLEAFGTDLRNMKVVPYSGITIVINAGDYTVPSAALDLTPEVAIARMALKHLSVSLYGNWWMCLDSPALLLLKRLLRYFSGVLKEIQLYIEDKREEFVQYFLGDCSFPRLEVLKLEEGNNRTSSETYTNYMRSLISRAESLQELHTNGPINLMSNFLEGSKALLVYNLEVNAPFGNIPETFIDRLRLPSVVMKYTGSGFNYKRFNRITQTLLRTCCTTNLKNMEMDTVLALPLMRYGVSLKALESLGININYNQMLHVKPEILQILKRFDFTRILPNVERVWITSYWTEFAYSSTHLDAFIEQANARLGERMPDRAAHVKELSICDADISDAAVSFYAEMFPNIEKLEIVADDEEEIPFGAIWKHLLDLRELEVTELLGARNLDSVFCGIFPEEVAELRLKDEEYLKEVHIVPVMPAITCLKNLETLTLYIDRPIVEPYVDDTMFMFSKVAGLIAFGRCPSIITSITVSRSDGFIPETSHLEAFASVTVL